MKKWNLIVDVARCNNCNNCTLATKDEHVGNDFPGYAAAQPAHGHHWIKIERKVRGATPMVDAAYMPTMCNHCDNAPCMAAAGKDAIVKRADGIVIIDPEKARGRKDLVGACPYGAISWNEELQLPQIWIFDAHLLDQGWQEPRCVQACPTGVFQALKVEDSEMKAIVERDGLEVHRAELGTRPRVYYRNLYRYAKRFIGGTVIVDRDGVVDCVSDAKVRLSHGSALIAELETDHFGDFKFDGLQAAPGDYSIDISHAQLGSARVETSLDESRYVGMISLHG